MYKLKSPEDFFNISSEAMTSESRLGGGGAVPPSLPSSMGITSEGVVPVNVVAIKEGLTIGFGGATGVSKGITPGQYIEEEPLVRRTGTMDKSTFIDYGKIRTRSAASTGENVDEAMKILESTEFAKELNKYMVPPKISEGSGIHSLYRNIKALHDQAKLYQEEIGISFKEIYGRIPKTISLEIEKAAVSGPDYTTFIRQLDIFKNNPEALSGGDTLKSWKLYRMAVGDFFMAQAQQAEDNLAATVVSGDSDAEVKAYTTFKRSIGDARIC